MDLGNYPRERPCLVRMPIVPIGYNFKIQNSNTALWSFTSIAQVMPVIWNHTCLPLGETVAGPGATCGPSTAIPENCWGGHASGVRSDHSRTAEPVLTFVA